MGRPVNIQACLNGARPPAVHPALPVTPAEITADVQAVMAVGACGVHVHPKDSVGLDALDPDSVDAVMTSIRVAAPAVQVSVTTGAWAMPNPADRLAAVRAWSVLPDLASVNWHEDGSHEVAVALLERGVGIEAGLWSIHDVSAWAASPVRDEVSRVLLELTGGIGGRELVALAQAMVGGVRAASPHVPILLHGEGTSAWSAVRHAVRLGVDSRIGLEDTLLMPDGSEARDNAALVTAALRLT